jgi:glycosyltransferase involved in cell wall biosynthesis
MSVDLSIVVAVYNEDPRNLVKLLERLWTVVEPLNMTYEVIFVNDGSNSTTSKALLQIAREVASVKLVVLSRNFGQQAAISAGIDYASGQAVINMDSDLQDPPELITDMVKYWKLGYEVVYATRSQRQDRLSKRLSAFLFYRLLTLLSSVKIPWDTGDFRLIDRKVVNALSQMKEKTRFLRGQIPWLGFKQIGIPIDRGARELGESTYTLPKLLRLATDGILAFSLAPLFIIPFIGGAVLIGSLIALMVFVYKGIQIASVEILISAIGIFAGIQLLCIGLASIYLSKVLDEVRGRPTYVVSDFIAYEKDNDSTEDASLQKHFAPSHKSGTQFR